MAITKVNCPKCGCEATFDSGGLLRPHEAVTCDYVFDDEEQKTKLVQFKWSCDGGGATMTVGEPRVAFSNAGVDVVCTHHDSWGPTILDGNCMLCGKDQTPQAG